jgi:hypothetical protein
MKVVLRRSINMIGSDERGINPLGFILVQYMISLIPHNKELIRKHFGT